MRDLRPESLTAPSDTLGGPRLNRSSPQGRVITGRLSQKTPYSQRAELLCASPPLSCTYSPSRRGPSAGGSGSGQGDMQTLRPRARIHVRQSDPVRATSGMSGFKWPRASRRQPPDFLLSYLHDSGSSRQAQSRGNLARPPALGFPRMEARARFARQTSKTGRADGHAVPGPTHPHQAKSTREIHEL